MDDIHHSFDYTHHRQGHVRTLQKLLSVVVVCIIKTKASFLKGLITMNSAEIQVAIALLFVLQLLFHARK